MDHSFDQEPQPQFRSLPIISEDTRRKITEEIGMGMPAGDRENIAKIHGEHVPASPYQLLRECAVNIFSDMASVNPEAVRQIQNGINRGFNGYEGSSPGRVASYESWYSQGMAIVLRAFEVEEEYDLLSRFGSLEEQELQLLQDAVSEALGGGKTQSLLDEALSLPRIPEQQTSLISLVKTAIKAQPEAHSYIRKGSSAMYKVFTIPQIHAKLFPPKAAPNPYQQQ